MPRQREWKREKKTEGNRLEYTQTGNFTAKVKLNGHELKGVTEFEFKHEALNVPTAVITVFNPNAVITTIDCDVVKKGADHDS